MTTRHRPHRSRIRFSIPSSRRISVGRLSGIVVASSRVVCFVRVGCLDVVVFEFVSSSAGSASMSRSVFLCSSGRIMALSAALSDRRGSAERDRVVARRRWLQNWQCWVWIGRRVVILVFAWFLLVFLFNCRLLYCWLSGGRMEVGRC